MKDKKNARKHCRKCETKLSEKNDPKITFFALEALHNRFISHTAVSRAQQSAATHE